MNIAISEGKVEEVATRLREDLDVEVIERWILKPHFVLNARNDRVLQNSRQE
jgi:hypothetical protein